MYNVLFFKLKREYYFIETACQCSQIVQFNYASVLFNYFSNSSFLIFFMVPSVFVLTEFRCFIKGNICQTVMQTSCELSRTVS